MERKHIINYFIGAFFIYIIISISACSKKFVPFIPTNPPPPLYFPKDVNVTLINIPPLLIIDNENISKSSIGSQYFKIAIPPCVDMTGKAEYLKNSLSDIFYTALFETKRFSLMDRMEIKKIIEVDLTGLINDTAKINKQIIDKNLQIYDESSTKAESIIKILKNISDGILQIYITSDEKKPKSDTGKVWIDYRIVRTSGSDNEPIVLFAGSKEISYNYNATTSSLSFNRKHINEIANEIKEKFPNPDIQENLRITNKRGNVITVNAGKNDNIITGMLGFVVSVNQDLYGNNIVSYRAEFQVTEVFSDTFNAILIEKDEEDKAIIPTIRVDEQIKMK